MIFWIFFYFFAFSHFSRKWDIELVEAFLNFKMFLMIIVHAGNKSNVCLPICLSAYLAVCLFVCLSVCLSVCPICLSVSLSVSLFFSRSLSIGIYDFFPTARSTFIGTSGGSGMKIDSFHIRSLLWFNLFHLNGIPISLDLSFEAQFKQRIIKLAIFNLEFASC